MSCLRLLSCLWLAAATPGPAPSPVPADPLRDLQAAARAAYDRHDHATFLARTEEALRLRPDSPRLLYNRACGLALTGQPAGALAALADLADRQLDFDLQAEPDFASLRPLPGWAAVAARFAALRQPRGQAVTAFRLPPGPLLIEGLAHDPRSGRFFASSVRQRRILAWRAEAPDHEGSSRREPPEIEDFVPAGRDGLLSPLALRADPARRRLWVTSAALPEAEAFREEEAGRSELLAFDLDDGRLLQRLPAPGPGEHNLNDLELDADGAVFVSDASSGQLWRLAPGARELSELLAAGRLRSPQGLALSRDGQSLYVADYASGLYRLDLVARALEPVPGPEQAVLAGIDGLLREGDGLIALQNGIRPHRVVRLSLLPDGRRVAGTEILAMGLPELDEPTLGVLVGERLVFVGRSQWASLGGGHGPPPAALPPAVILELGLRAPAPARATPPSPR